MSYTLSLLHFNRSRAVFWVTAAVPNHLHTIAIDSRKPELA